MGVPTAVVVGGGIAGLSAARALHRAGWRVTVLERAPQLGEVGAGLTLMVNAFRALEALGLAAAVQSASRPASAGGTRTRSGRWLSRIDGAAAERVLGTSAAGIHRATLHQILRDALPPESLVVGADVVDVTAGPPATVSYRRHGEPVTATADLVVAADGIDSTVRARLWPDTPPPAYVGSTAWRAVTPKPWPDSLPSAITWGPGAEFGVVPLGDGRVYWYAAVNAPAGQRFPDELAAVQDRFGSWHDPIPSLLAATPGDTVLRHDLYRLDPPPATYVAGRVVLVGDAAHAMPPFLGQGACQAIEDAAVLGWACAGTADVPTALAAYERERLPRTHRMMRASVLSGRFGQQLSNRAAVAVRDAALRLVPAGVALRAMTRDLDWHPPASPSRPAAGATGG